MLDDETVDMFAETGGLGNLGQLIKEADTPLKTVQLDVLDEDNSPVYWGRTTFVTVAEMSDGEHKEAIDHLIKYFMEVFGAPSAEAAEPHAREEIEYIAEMCSEKPVNTLFAVRRFVDDEDNLREEFHEIKTPPGEVDHARIWEVVPDDD